ncbi:MAG: YcnI family protein [Chloroflexi bacterium]|nr:YcnI family protein [Chloroflexota bacterium]
MMGRVLRTLTSASLISGLAALTLGVGAASAHITVWPQQSTAGASERYTVRVPTEKAVPTVKVRLEFPPEVTVSRFAPALGWQREVERDGTGRIAAVTWSGGSIAPDEFAEFTFLARNPQQAGKIAWKAYQTYQGGETMAWNGPENSEQPAAVVSIVPPGEGAPEALASSSGGMAWPLWLSSVAIVLSLTALVLSVVNLRRSP